MTALLTLIARRRPSQDLLMLGLARLLSGLVVVERTTLLLEERSSPDSKPSGRSECSNGNSSSGARLKKRIRHAQRRDCHVLQTKSAQDR